MTDLAESLQGKDLGHLRIIAGLWGRELAGQEAQSAILQLKSILLDPAIVEWMLSSLPPEASLALDDLRLHTGRLPWAQFSRVYGEIREMGPARRDRERPHENPSSAAEALWYSGLLARAFFDTSAGPEEFAYIPAGHIGDAFYFFFLPEVAGVVQFQKKVFIPFFFANGVDDQPSPLRQRF